MTARTLILGDWHPLVRDPLDLLRTGMVAAAIAFASLGLGGAVNLAVAAGAVVLVRPLNLPRPYDASFILAMAIVGFGEALRLYDRFVHFDTVVHFVVPLLGAPIVYIALARADVLSDPKDHAQRHQLVGLFVVTLALGLALGAAWEILEWISDHAFGSELQTGQEDTIGDLVADGAGALLGGGLLVAWATFGWGSVRRIPGQTEEDTEA
jgi:hypothetical protein